MKKISSLIAAIGLLSAANAFALVGGPFDGNDYGQSLDDQGIYQAGFRFKNGLGFAQWGLNVSMSGNINQGNSGQSSTNLTLGTYLNRSVIYYKGVTYVGAAFGMTDHDRGIVQGTTNGYSEASFSSSGTGGTNGNTTLSLSQTASYNGGRGFVANTSFECKITAKSPILKFNGSGELSVLSPDGNGIISALAQTIVNQNTNQTLQNLATALSTTIPTASGGTTTLAQILGGSNVTDTFAAADIVRMTVFGERKFFLSVR